MKTQSAPAVGDSEEDDFDPLGIYDVTIGSKWRYVYEIKSDGVVSWWDKANGQCGFGAWSYNNYGTLTFIWNGSTTKESWNTEKENGVVHYANQGTFQIKWRKRW